MLSQSYIFHDFAIVECGDRLNVRDIVILASDGASTLETDLVQSEAQKLIDNGIRTFAIGNLVLYYNVL